MRKSTQRARVAFILVAGSVLAAACSSSAAHPLVATTIPPATAPPDTATTIPVNQQVAAATQAYVAATRACLTNPAATCDLSAVALPPETTSEAQRLQSLAAKHLRAKPSPQTKLIDETIAIDPSGARATAQVCDIDADILYTPGAGPKGQDVIYNDSVGADRSDWTMTLDGGRWKVAEVRNFQHWDAASCPPAS